MENSSWLYPLILTVFGIGYLAIILEFNVKINKTATALILAVLTWSIYFAFTTVPLAEDINEFGTYLADVSQIIFFLMGAMTIVELIDAHKGFKIVTDVIRTTSKQKMLWTVSIVTFFLSSVLDNLTTAILMISLLKKMIPVRHERFILSCLIIVAANAGGAWTPIGDVTTTMLWINGQLSTLAVMKSLFLPSVVSLLVPILLFANQQKGKFSPIPMEELETKPEPKANLIFCLGMGSLIFVPIFKSLTGLPPFMGILLGLGLLWLVTDLIHHKYEHRHHLRIPAILSKIDSSGVLFFLGILLCIKALEAAGILSDLATFLSTTFKSDAIIATLIGLLSAIVDNVPLVAGTMGMYPLSQYPMDHSLWHMIAYAAGTGGSILIIGSAAGVAVMGLEKMDFVSYMKKMSLPVLAGYLAGMAVYLLQQYIFV